MGRNKNVLASGHLARAFGLIALGLVTLAAAQPATAENSSDGKFLQCELVCRFADGAGGWKSITTCTPHMDAKQCKASADNRNLSDAYPSRMNCSAQLVPDCIEKRE